MSVMSEHLIRCQEIAKAALEEHLRKQPNVFCAEVTALNNDAPHIMKILIEKSRDSYYQLDLSKLPNKSLKWSDKEIADYIVADFKKPKKSRVLTSYQS